MTERPRVVRWFPVLGLLAFVTALFSGALFGSGVFFQRDVAIIWYERIESTVRAVAEGSWPVWDPYVAFGVPSLADPSYQLLYAPTWLNLFLLPATCYKVLVLGHCLAAGLGLNVLSRRHGLPPLAAFTAAAVWCSSGPLLSAANLWHHYAGLAWLPWVLLALEVALETGTLGWTLVLGAAAAGQVLAGSGDVCVMTALAALGRMAQFVVGGTGRLAAALRVGGVALAYALALAGAQLAPTLAALGSASRPLMPALVKLSWSLHPALGVDFLVPGLVAELPLSEPLRATLLESKDPLLHCLYLGMAAALLVALAAVSGKGPFRSLALWGFGFFLVCALGRYTPVYPALLKVPVISFFRYPVKHVMAASFFWAALAGLGVDAWLRPWSEGERRRARLVVAGAALLALGAWAACDWLKRDPWLRGFLVGQVPQDLLTPTFSKLRVAAVLAAASAGLLFLRQRRSQPTGGLTAGVLVLVLGDLLVVGRGINPLAPAELLERRPPLVERLLPTADNYRVAFMESPMDWVNRQIVRAPQGWPVESELNWTLGLQDLLWPPGGGRWRLRGSYDGDPTGLGPPPVLGLTLMLQQAKGTPLGLKLLQMGNVGHVVSIQDAALPGLEKVVDLPSVFASPIHLFHVPDPLPRAYIVDGVRIADEPESYRAVQDPAFDPRHEVILSGGVLPRASTTGFTGRARVALSRVNAVRLEADLEAPGILVLVDAYDPGWRASVDGERVPVLRANLLFRAVALPPGRHVVEFRYRSAGALGGMLLSIGAAAFGLGYWELRGRARRPSDTGRLGVGDSNGAGAW